VRLLVGDTGSTKVRETMQATFLMGSMENGSVGLIWDIGESLIVGESRTYLGNNLLERQHTKCQRYSHLDQGWLPIKALGQCIIKSEAN
jgi:hypothetical protein